MSFKDRFLVRSSPATEKHFKKTSLIRTLSSQPSSRDEKNVFHVVLSNLQNINIPDKDGNSPLHWSLDWPVEVMQFLLNHGARWESKNKKELTSFDVAFQNAKVDHLHVLCETIKDPQSGLSSGDPITIFTLIDFFLFKMENVRMWETNILQSMQYFLDRFQDHENDWVTIFNRCGVLGLYAVNEMILLSGRIQSRLEEVLNSFCCHQLDHLFFEKWMHSPPFQSLCIAKLACFKAPSKKDLCKVLEVWENWGGQWNEKEMGVGQRAVSKGKSWEYLVIQKDAFEYFPKVFMHASFTNENCTNWLYDCPSIQALKVLTKLIAQRQPKFPSSSRDISFLSQWRIKTMFLFAPPLMQNNIIGVLPQRIDALLKSSQSRKDLYHYISRTVIKNPATSLFLLLIHLKKKPTPMTCEVLRFHLFVSNFT